MEQYSELYFKGSEEDLRGFVKELEHYQTNEWIYKKEKIYGTNYLSFVYCGEKLPKAAVSICIDEDYIKRGILKVGNIVPLEMPQISMKQYNLLLKCFYDDVIIPFSDDHNSITIDGPTSDRFDPLTIISEKALQDLRIFSNCANKTTGTSHPMDQERWLEFICQTVDDNQVFDSDTLARFLQDEEFWGMRVNTAINSGAWSEEMAWELASEYENAVDVLQYYKRTRGR